MPARFHALISNFVFGETSPRVNSRVAGENIFGMSATDVYRSGCREVSNIIILPQGGAYFREGFRFGRDTTLDIAFGDSVGQQYRIFQLRGDQADLILLMTPAVQGQRGKAWVYSLPNFVAVGGVDTPYTTTDMADLGVAQYQNSIVIYSAQHRPRTLVLGDSGISLVDPGANFIAPLYAYKDHPAPPPQKGSWTVAFTFPTGSTAGSLIMAVSGVAAIGKGGFAIQTGIYLGNDPKTIDELTRSMDAIDAVVKGVTAINHVSTVGQVATYTIDYSYYSSRGDGTGLLSFTPPSFIGTISPAVTITQDTPSVGDAEPLWSGPFLIFEGGVYWECIAPHVAAAINRPNVGANYAQFWVYRGDTVPTDQDYDVSADAWAIDDAYSPRGRGWPPVMGFHEQRLVGAGPRAAPSVIAAGIVADLFNFKLGVNDADGLLFRLATASNSIVRWFHSTEHLSIGTSAGVFIQMAQPWTPTNVSFKRVNGYQASVHVHATEVAGDLFFSTIDDRQIRQVQFSNDLQSWQSWELAQFAEHLFTDTLRVKQVVAHEGIETLLWAVRTDGALLGMTYSPGQSAYHALAWHKHNLSDPVIEVASAFDGSRYVTVALVFRRQFNGVVWSYYPVLEVLDHISQNLFDEIPTFFHETHTDKTARWDVVPYSGPNWSVHLDSWANVYGNGSRTLTVPLRFIGRPVAVVENGVYLGEFTPDGTGSIPVDTVNQSVIYVGYRYHGRIEPNRLESQSSMTSQSLRQRWVKPVMRLVTSAMPLLNGTRPNERTQDDFYDTATGLFSGDVYVANFGSDGKLVIEADLPLPMHLTGIFGLITTEEG